MILILLNLMYNFVWILQFIILIIYNNNNNKKNNLLNKL